MYSTDYIESILKVFSLTGILFGFYFIFQLILGPLIAFQSEKMLKRLRTVLGFTTPSKNGDGYCPSFIPHIPWNSVFKTSGLGIEPQKWTVIKRRLFNGIDIEKINDEDIKIGLKVLRFYFFMHKLAFYTWVATSVGVIIFILKFLITK